MATARRLTLGIDLGANSVGWAVIADDGRQRRIIDAGARIFPAGVDGELESGKEQSRNVARRDARQARRQADRRARRLTHIARLLQQGGLLPPGDVTSPKERHDLLHALDRRLRDQFLEQTADVTATDHVFPYWLRAHALDHPLPPHALGRALYHLAQRRGFLSNRRAPRKDEDEGEVKTAIQELEKMIRAANARTLGEYFASLDPTDPESDVIRRRWTGRQMFIDEFDAIWRAQAPYHPHALSEEGHDALYKAVFHQRPPKSVRGLIGKCELESGKRRAPIAILPAQRFRYLQKLNDLDILFNESERRKLTPEERQTTLQLLETQQEVKFTSLRKRLGLRGTMFNLEAGGEKRMLGNSTASRLRKIFGERWDALSADTQRLVIEDLLSINKSEVLERRGRDVWGLDSSAARAFGDLVLEDGYCRLSRPALEKLLPHMEQGVAFATAKKEVYGVTFGHYVCDLLPAVDDAPFELRNPVVHRSLTELRKVVNAVSLRHGKPDVIRLELARDLKNTKKQREDTWKKNRRNQKEREDAARRILKEVGNPRPSRDDVQRVLLAEECNWECPYTGRPISMTALFGESSQFDIEHIIPQSRCFDNSFLNKTLCYHEENRGLKCGRTPFEAYGSQPERWEAILTRVRRFKGDARDAKLRRVLCDDIEDFDDFTARQLNDTRYASTLAADYVGLLYGGRWDTNGVLRVQAGRGSITKDIRDAYQLNRILNDGDRKSRDDHRHHAVDAIAVALSDPATVRALSTAAAGGERSNERPWRRYVAAPWDGFLQEATEAIERIVVSHRPLQGVNGPLHEETHYSPEMSDANGRPCVHVRKKLEALSAKEVGAIVDPQVRECVETRLRELGGGEPKRVFNKDTLPYLVQHLNGSERRVPIRSVRVRRYSTTFQVGQGARARHVVAATNHHMEIIESTNKNGATVWKDAIVDQYTAMRRHHRREPLVQRDHGPGTRFVFSLSSGDIIQLD
jgi:CRISPR-associated endonuclease Csn1